MEVVSQKSSSDGSKDSRRFNYQLQRDLHEITLHCGDSSRYGSCLPIVRGLSCAPSLIRGACTTGSCKLVEFRYV